jgi:hypothetical protein
METDDLEGTVRLLERFQAMSFEERQAMSRRAIECYQNRYALKNAAQELYEALGLA